ncbi:unnamed protein product, partial [Larinioides sclopetarius]
NLHDVAYNSLNAAGHISTDHLFYEAQALIRDSKVWVKIPKRYVMDARLSVGCFTRFEVIFEMKQSLYTVAHNHVDTINILKVQQQCLFEVQAPNTW